MTPGHINNNNKEKLTISSCVKNVKTSKVDEKDKRVIVTGKCNILLDKICMIFSALQ